MTAGAQMQQGSSPHEDTGKPRRPERAIAFAFALTAACAAGFCVLYWLGGQVQIEGALLGLGLAALAYGFGAWAKLLLPATDYVEAHEDFAPAPPERAALEAEAARDTSVIGRRGLLGGMLALALGALGVAALFPIRSLFPGRKLLEDSLSQLETTAWQDGSVVVRKDGTPVRPADLLPGTLLTVFPEGHTEDGDTPTLLVRLDPAKLQLPPGRQSFTVGGIVAYSKLCTHAGCPVGLFEAETSEVFCPCHQSVFALLEGAKPTGGPAARPLPQLPITVGSDGTLRATGDFTAPVGPGFWRKS